MEPETRREQEWADRIEDPDEIADDERGAPAVNGETEADALTRFKTVVKLAIDHRLGNRNEMVSCGLGKP